MGLIARLTSGLPRPAARRLRKELVNLITRSHQTDHRPPPDWIIELRRLGRRSLIA